MQFSKGAAYGSKLALNWLPLYLNWFLKPKADIHIQQVLFVTAVSEMTCRIFFPSWCLIVLVSLLFEGGAVLHNAKRFWF